MKKLNYILVIVLAMALLSGCSKNETKTSNTEGDTSLTYIEEKGQLVMGLDDTFAPMGFRDENNEIVGFDVDMAKEVCADLGFELVLQPIDWGTKDISLKNKEIDVIWNGLTITDERKEKMEFSQPYIGNRQSIIINADSSINKIEDLKGKKIAVQIDSSAEKAVESNELFSEFGSVEKYDDYTQALMDLEIGRVDAVVIDEIMGRYKVGKTDGKFKFAEENFGAEFYGIGMRKGEVALKDAINKALNDLIENGKAAEVSEKWFGEDIVERP